MQAGKKEKMVPVFPVIKKEKQTLSKNGILRAQAPVDKAMGLQDLSSNPTSAVVLMHK